MGGPVNPFESQSSSQSIQSTSVSFDYNKLAEVFDKRIDNKIKLIKSKVVLTDVKDGLDTLVSLKREADV